MSSWLASLFGGAKPPSGDGEERQVPQEIRAPSTDVLSSGAGDASRTPGPDSAPDASVLERIAAAATKLRGDENAPNLIELMKVQEITWQERFRKEKEEASTEAEQARRQNMEVQQQVNREKIEMENRAAQQRMQAQDEMERKRHQDQLAQHARAAEQQRQLQLQAVQQQEQQKQQTMQYQAQLDRETAVVRAKAEGKAAAEQERENRDIRDNQVIMRAKEDRMTRLDEIKLSAQLFRDTVADYATDWKRVGISIGIVTGLALGVYGARSGMNVVGKMLADRLGRPPLVRDTSRASPVLNPLKALRRLFSKPSGDAMDGIVLNEAMAERLRDITISASQARQHGANFRHLMLYGPPGTGKTMFASSLAQQSGLDYAVIAGGDVGPLGPDAVTELHRVFDWGASSKKGMLLFVDEADAFLRKRGARGDGSMSENMRNTLSTFLQRTGGASNTTMIVVATNEPAAMDYAVLDRMDEVVEFALPGEPERAALLGVYFRSAITNPSGSARPVLVDDAVAALVEQNFGPLAAELDGFSGRQIMKLANAWQAAAYASPDNTLTMEMLQREVDIHRQQRQQSKSWADVQLGSHEAELAQ